LVQICPQKNLIQIGWNVGPTGIELLDKSGSTPSVNEFIDKE